jgi:pimeloyl-ACP methyl ester carboxylesterase
MPAPPGTPITAFTLAVAPRPPPREAAERQFNIRRWAEMPRGGHVAAWEQPALLAEEIRSFFRDRP